MPNRKRSTRRSRNWARKRGRIDIYHEYAAVSLTKGTYTFKRTNFEFGQGRPFRVVGATFDGVAKQGRLDANNDYSGLAAVQMRLYNPAPNTDSISSSGLRPVGVVPRKVYVTNTNGVWWPPIAADSPLIIAAIDVDCYEKDAVSKVIGRVIFRVELGLEEDSSACPTLRFPVLDRLPDEEIEDTTSSFADLSLSQVN